MATFEASRPIVGAQAVGMARAAVRVRARVRQDRASSSAAPIVENQAIAFKLADMKTSVDAARLLVLARRVDGARTGHPFDAC